MAEIITRLDQDAHVALDGAEALACVLVAMDDAEASLP
jgi:hypothetical protein